MNLDVECSSASTQKHLEIIRLDISELTTPLPEQVKARWGPYKQRQLPHSGVTLDQIQAKLAAADEKRKVPGLRLDSICTARNVRYTPQHIVHCLDRKS